jgi:hypothetical protein
MAESARVCDETEKEESGGSGLERPSTGPASFAAVFTTPTHNNTGVAVFDAEAHELWVCQSADDEEHAFLKLALDLAAPRTIYVSSKASHTLLEALDKIKGAMDHSALASSIRAGGL